MNKSALITGAAKRLGKMIALSLAEEGYEILLHYNSSEEEAINTKKEIEALSVPCKLIKRDLMKSAKDLIKEAREISKGLEVLVNSASIFKKENPMELNEENFFETIKINSFIPLDLSIQWKKEINKGIIINIIDARVHQFDFTHFSYGLSKKILYQITKQLAFFFAPEVRVNGIAPGIFLPPEGEDEKYIENILKLVPIRRKGEKKDLKKALKYLIENDYVTGQIIYVDGGRHLGKNIY